MEKVPKSMRLHIGVFGRRNVGKSSVLNALVGQAVSIVSETPGTTTDAVEKVMELKPIGPVVFIDTAGVDDMGTLGEQRVRSTRKVIERTELAILVSDEWTAYEKGLVKEFKRSETAVVVAANKADIRGGDEVERAASEAGLEFVVSTTAVTGAGIEKLKAAIAAAAGDAVMRTPTVVGDLVKAGETVVLVTPIDLEAPAGRMLLPQVQTIRDVLDNDCCCVVTKEDQLGAVLGNLKLGPALVVTDSQAFARVDRETPAEVAMTSFSILFTRLKGDLDEMVRGARAIDSLKGGDNVLIAEACTHRPLEGDIGREKIPNWLAEKVGAELNIEVTAGRDFPDDLSKFKLVIHCASCVFNRKQLLWRIAAAKGQGVAITNYGVTIAYCLGILERALRPFPSALAVYREQLVG